VVDFDKEKLNKADGSSFEVKDTKSGARMIVSVPPKEGMDKDTWEQLTNLAKAQKVLGEEAASGNKEAAQWKESFDGLLASVVKQEEIA